MPRCDKDWLFASLMMSAGLEVELPDHGDPALRPQGHILRLSELSQLVGEPEKELVRIAFPAEHWAEVADDVLVGWYPFRAAAERQLRRSRLADVPETARTATLFRLGWAYGWDYFLLMNVCLWSLCLTDREWAAAQALRLFERGLDGFVKAAKRLSSAIKTRASTLSDKFKEMQVLAGYRLTPMPGFDLLSRAEGMVDNDIAVFNDGDFDRVLELATPMTPKAVERLSFREWFALGSWQRAGSASLGGYEWVTADDRGKAPIRKNLLLDLFDEAELFAWVVRYPAHQWNKAIEKNERTKVRLAVSGDFPNYVRTAYLLYYLNGAYKQWPGNTMGEDLAEQTDRELLMLQALTSGVGVPFDFEGFDLQPMLDQLASVARRVGRVASAASGGHPDVIEVARLVEAAVTDAWLEVREHRTLRVAKLWVSSPDGAAAAAGLPFEPPTGVGWTAGDADADWTGVAPFLSVLAETVAAATLRMRHSLASGGGLTSLSGNAFNSTLATKAAEIMRAIGSDTLQARYVRGDDTSGVGRNYGVARLFIEVMRALGVRIAEGAFGLRRGEGEFLRQRYSDKVSAYLARAVTAGTSRTPWSNDPFDPVATLRAQASARDTMLRRGADQGVWAWWDRVARAWCKRTSLDRRWLAASPLFGGLGLEPGDWAPSRAAPPVEMPEVDLANPTRRREVELEAMAERWRAQADPAAVRRVAARARARALMTDAPGSLAKAAREAWIDAFPQVSWRQVRQKKGMAQDVKVPEVRVPGQMALRMAEPGGRLYASEPTIATVWEEASTVAALSGQSASAVMMRERPDLWHAVRRLTGRGLTIGQALDWLSGGVSWGMALNPVVLPLASRYASRVATSPFSERWTPRSWSDNLFVAARLAEEAVSRSPWYQRLFN